MGGSAARTVTIHVFLPKEAVSVWAPCDAEHVRDDVYRIVNCRGEDAEVQFGKGALVRCEHKRLSGDGGVVSDTLVAVEEVTYPGRNVDLA